MSTDGPVEAVVFDVNGVLVDSMGLHVRLTRELLAEAGVELTEDQLRAYRGLAAVDLFRAARDDADVEFDAAALAERKLEAFAGAVEELPVTDGAAETVRAVGEDHAVGVASNDQRRAVDAVLDRLGVADVVSAVVTIDDVATGKPDPAVYRQAVERLGVTPGVTVAVEDSRVGVEAACAAGLRVVGYQGDEEDDLSAATTTVERLPDLPAAIAALG